MENKQYLFIDLTKSKITRFKALIRNYRYPKSLECGGSGHWRYINIIDDHILITEFDKDKNNQCVGCPNCGIIRIYKWLKENDTIQDTIIRMYLTQKIINGINKEDAVDYASNYACKIPLPKNPDCDDSQLCIRVNGYPRSFQFEVAQKFHTITDSSKRILDPKMMSQVLNLVYIKNSLYIGTASYPEVFFLPRKRAFKENNHTDRQISKAQSKIQEILLLLEKFGNPDFCIPKQSWTVVDVGAAPGGWSYYMAPLVKQVIAIDPGAIDINESKMKNITHLKKRVQETTNELAQLDGLELILCDMNKDSRSCARNMLELLVPYLEKDKGLCILTIKLLDKSPTRQKRAILQTAEIFHLAFQHVQVFHLFYNTINERTIVGYGRKSEWTMDSEIPDSFAHPLTRN